jgi:hypothetical protein
VAEQEKMVPLSQAWRMLGTGMQWEAGLFIETYWQLKELLGRDKAKEILRKSMFEAGVTLGKEIAEEVGRTDALGIAQAWELMYGITPGGEGTEELSDDVFIWKGSGCAAYDLMKRWGVSDEELAFLSDSYCAGDDGFVAGFNPDMKFEPTHRLTRGDGFCRWVHSTEK